MTQQFLGPLLALCIIEVVLSGLTVVLLTCILLGRRY